MSIGSIGPDDNVSCIKNIYFKNVTFDRPMKAIYIKTNPGDDGSGIVKNITFEDIKMKTPVWFGIYIGPQ